MPRAGHFSPGLGYIRLTRVNEEQNLVTWTVENNKGLEVCRVSRRHRSWTASGRNISLETPGYIRILSLGGLSYDNCGRICDEDYSGNNLDKVCEAAKNAKVSNSGLSGIPTVPSVYVCGHSAP